MWGGGGIFKLSGAKPKPAGKPQALDQTSSPRITEGFCGFSI